MRKENFGLKLFPKINKNVIEAVAETKALLIYADNLYMYATINGEEISEDYPQNATSKKGILRKELAEELLSQVQRINFKLYNNFEKLFVNSYYTNF